MEKTTQVTPPTDAPKKKCSCGDNVNGFATSYWGPCLWYILKFFCARSNGKGIDSEYDTFLFNCGSLMPCSFCRHHFSYIFKSAINLDDRDLRIQALQNMHNLVSLKVEDTIQEPLDSAAFQTRFSDQRTLVFSCRFFFTAVLLNSGPRTSGEEKMKPQEYQDRVHCALAYVREHLCPVNGTSSSDFICPVTQLENNGFDVDTFELFRAKRDLNHCFVTVAEHIAQRIGNEKKV